MTRIAHDVESQAPGVIPVALGEMAQPPGPNPRMTRQTYSIGPSFS
jgi:hypothetical protein